MKLKLKKFSKRFRFGEPGIAAEMIEHFGTEVTVVGDHHYHGDPADGSRYYNEECCVEILEDGGEWDWAIGWFENRSKNAVSWGFGV